ncbi:MAG: hypothetical protein GWN18_13820, partial [Thermoplasmata archaeon]|nr:hypothetical protein [Thermoplasmata archaeon]NIS13141.1 hypothetical protein [Thermoplasmata archaeon]NIS21035.1 hypothetical protein [Thermoplasmata archaeon]NIT78500.1 hypothetical protein [Thermoplasmata archaeon]NIU50085.1 hypothetical protein [Thermoplasmata archaeon]
LTEGEEGELDLAPYLSDANDAVSSLTLSCGDGNVSVDGLVLRGLFDVSGERVLLVTVSDGDDAVDAEVHVRVANVNDAPVITGLSPVNGTRLKAGGTVTLTVEAWDEDGDQLQVTWMRGKRVLGTGTTLLLKDADPGRLVVRVVVSDGGAEAEGDLFVVVEDAEGLSWLWWAVVVVVIVAAAAVVVYSRSRRGSG